MTSREVYVSTISNGEDLNGRPYVAGIPCCECGKFVGRDGVIHIETFEMSNVVASVDGTCGRCLRAAA